MAKQRNGASRTTCATAPRGRSSGADRLLQALAADEVPLAERVRQHLAKRKRVVTLEELSDHFDIGLRRVREAVAELSKKHVSLVKNDREVGLTPVIEPSEATPIPKAALDGKEYIFGLTADNHLCSKYARMDVLNALFDMWQDDGVKVVFQAGNMIDGEARFNVHDLLVRGLDNQIDYFVEHWPQRKGIETHFVTGDDHEGWYIQREGVNVGRMMQDAAQRSGRTDLKFLGHMEHTFLLAEREESRPTIQLMHAGGGSAYAISYTSQKLAESYQGGEKPQAVLIGHYHKYDHTYVREVHAVQAGCTQDQSPFMRKKKIQAMVGGVTIKFRLSQEGLMSRFWSSFQPFYDRNFYKNSLWRYRWK
jgi:uncharacterized protein YjiS (DUF1127 family)